MQYGKESRRGETGKAACALRELPRRPRSEAAAPVRHCEPPPGLPPARPPLWVPVRAAMGHLPASTRGGRRLLPLLGLFVLLKVGSPAPRPRSSRRPRSAPGSAATDLGAPGREGRAAGSTGCAAGRTLCCPGGRACPALLGDVVGEGGSLLPPAFNLCAPLPISEVGLLVHASSGRVRPLSLLLAATCCAPMLPNLPASPSGVRACFVLIYLLRGLHRGRALSSPAARGLLGVGRENGFLWKRSVSLSRERTPRSLRKPFTKSPDFPHCMCRG